MICYFIYAFLLCVTASSNTIELSHETKNVLKKALEVGDKATIDALYTSIITGDTFQFASIINNTSNYFEQLSSTYAHPTSIAITIDNNATVRDLAMFDYLTDDRVIKIIEYYLNRHRAKPFIADFQLLECYKGLMSLELADTLQSEDKCKEAFTQDDLRKAILAIVYYSNVYALRNTLNPHDNDENTTVSLYQSLLRLSAVLQKETLNQELLIQSPNNTSIRTTLKDALTTAHTFFQTLYCKNILH